MLTTCQPCQKNSDYRLFEDSVQALIELAKMLEAAWKTSSKKKEESEEQRERRIERGVCDLFFDMEDGFQQKPQAMVIACTQLSNALEELLDVPPEENNYEPELDVVKCCKACVDTCKKLLDQDWLGLNNNHESKLMAVISDKRTNLITQVMTDLKHFAGELAKECGRENLFVMIRPSQFLDTKTYSKLICAKRDSTDGLNDRINQAYAEKHLIRYFPLHDAEYKRFLVEQWGNPQLIYSANWNWIPLDQVVAYFGEEIGFYFQFLKWYTTMLSGLTFVSLLFFAQQLTNNDSLQNFDLVDWAPFYSGILIIWAIVLTSTWQNEEKLLQVQWNMSDFDSSEQAKTDQRSSRPQYDELKHSTVRLVFSYFICFILISLDVAMIFGLLILRWYLTWATDYAWVSSALQGIVIVVVNILLKEVAILLTEAENHVTNTEFEKHLIAKSFALEATNSYLILAVTAFVKKNGDYFDVTNLLGFCTCPDAEWRAPTYNCTLGTETTCETCVTETYGDENCTCDYPDCLSEIGSTILSVFLTNMLIGNLMEVGMPFICGKVRQKIDWFTSEQLNEEHKRNSLTDIDTEETTERSSRESVAFVTQQQRDNGLRVLPAEIREERHMHPYFDHVEGYFGVFDDMNEMAIQFGFIIMFSLSFPAACLLAFINNVIELRSDAWKLCRMTQRPWPAEAPGLGIWNTIFLILTVLGIITNTLLLLWTSRFGEHIDNDYKVLVFVAIEHGVVLWWLILTSQLAGSSKLIMAQFTRDEVKEAREADAPARRDFYTRDV